MNKNLRYLSLLLLCLLATISAQAWPGMPLPRLHVDGRYFKDNNGNIVNLHGFAQTYSPWFNEENTQWGNYDVQACLRYNQQKIDQILAAGWKMTFVRQHMDPYWSNEPNVPTTGESDISAFRMERFKKYLDEVFVPMALYAVDKGLYVVMRPPGVCPEYISVGGEYHKYLLDVWKVVAQHPKLRNHPNIMFELANEPIKIKAADGSDGGFKEMHDFFQQIVDVMRQYCDNIILVPGLAYQANYTGYADYPITGKDIGYAVHCYPGWFNSGTEEEQDVNYEDFQRGWDEQIGPVSDFAPVIVTEMDWAPEKYGKSWGKAITGEAGGKGFGANFKLIADKSGNVSYLIFTGCELLAQFDANNPATSDANTTFLNDPEACPWPVYHWYQDYATKEYPRQDFTRLYTADNGDGTFNNPILNADFPDPDVIRVGDTYYMVTTTFHNFPGCTLLKSNDLVNWEYCANPLEKMSSNPEYNLENDLDIYAKGDWANSLAYKDGKFYILFNAFGNADDGGGYLLSATDPEGSWEMTRLSRGYYDPGMLVDEDGTLYVACGNGTLSVVQLDDNFEPVKEVTVDGGFDGLEGSHFYKIGEYYYIYAVSSGWPGTQWCFRSKNVFGPYEKKLVFDDGKATHQGALVQTQGNEWWTILMRDAGSVGRVPNLLPVSWEDGWPVIAGNNANAVNLTYQKPNVDGAYPVTYLPTNDNFRDYKLGMQWQWNHNPDNTAWSLFDNPGYLRLYTTGTANNPKEARNSLTQRIFQYRDNTPSLGSVCLDLSGMKDGDVAGISVFQDPYGYIAISKDGNAWKLTQAIVGDENENFTVSTDVTPVDNKIYLRASADFQANKASFLYSLDNASWQPLGEEMTMAFDLSVFAGNRFMIFNYATGEEGGYVDVDWFSTEPVFSEDTYYDPNFTSYSEDYLTVSNLESDRAAYTLLPGTNKSFKLMATFKDGHQQDVTTEAKFEIANPGVLSISNGRLMPLAEGETTVTATYTDPMDNMMSISFDITVALFPLTQDGVNPNIWETGSWDATTRTLITGQWGFGGWQYSTPVDLSGYKYVVIEFATPPSCGASFRLFDENNYWSSPAMVACDGKSKVLVELSTLVKDGTTTPLDPSHIYIAGFWSNGGQPIKIKNIFVSQDGVTSGIDEVETADGNELVDVYNLQGILLYENVTRAEAEALLKPGIYIIGGEKVVIP